MGIEAGEHGTQHSSEQVILAPVSSPVLVKPLSGASIQYWQFRPQSPSQVSWYFPLSQRMEESQIQTLRLQSDELCWLGSSQPEASGTFPSIEYVASLNMVLTQGRCVTSSK